MKIVPRIKPGSRSASILHTIYIVFFASIIFAITIQPIGLPLVAVTILLLGKWRMVAVKPRHWLTNIRANLVDIGIGISTVIFLNGTDQFYLQVIYGVMYVIWLTLVKPRSSALFVSIQATIAQLVMLIALYGTFSNSSVLALVILTWLICYACARHFFSSFEEIDGRLMAHIWGIFGAEMSWILSHWMIAYGPLPQIAILLTVIGYSFAIGYYLHATRGIKASQRNQLIVMTTVMLIVIIFLTKWQYDI